MRKSCSSFAAVLIFLFVLAGLAYAQKKKGSDLMILSEYKLKIPEPSGLTLSFDGKSLWSVSDQNNRVYQISLSGKEIRSFQINALDLEGITFINDSTLAVVSEASSEMIFVTTTGKELNRRKINLKSSYNSGLEGITYDPKSGSFFLLMEKNPALLIKYDAGFKEVFRKEFNRFGDISGIDFAVGRDELWLISDESKTIIRCKPDGTVKNSYKMKITQMEGVAVDPLSKKIYVVSDRDEKLYVLQYK